MGEGAPISDLITEDLKKCRQLYSNTFDNTTNSGALMSDVGLCNRKLILGMVIFNTALNNSSEIDFHWREIYYFVCEYYLS